MHIAECNSRICVKKKTFLPPHLISMPPSYHPKKISLDPPLSTEYVKVLPEVTQGNEVERK